MPRTARIVLPDVPHHVTQRGARRMTVFFSSADYKAYLRVLARHADRNGVAVWAYCLMPNHVHLIAVPQETQSLARAIGGAHKHFAARVNQEHGWKGHLWQERFGSYPMDELHLHFAVRYILQNPVRAGLVNRPEEWPFSSAQAHIDRRADPLIDPAPLAGRIEDWSGFLKFSERPQTLEKMREHSRTGRPLGQVESIRRLEDQLGERNLTIMDLKSSGSSTGAK